MKRIFLPITLAALLLLSACGTTPSQSPAPPPPAVEAPPAPPPPAVEEPPTPAPVPQPPMGAPPERPVPVQVEPTPTPVPVPAPAQPVVTWRPRGIGLPLAPSDPEAAEQRVAMLTFDDGPTEQTVPILETLAKEDVKAVFFITGYSARNHPELVERIHKEGHQLGVHTMTHPNMRTLSKEDQRKEIEPLIDLIQQVTGQRPRYFRPPFGAYNQDLLSLLEELEMELINWTNGSLDWEGVVHGRKPPDVVVQTVIDQLHRGAVILFHDTMSHTAEALPEVIRQMKAEGYGFVSLP